MSNSGKRDESKDDALAALHGLHGSSDEQHEEHEDPEHEAKQPEAREDASAAASGFVGMLAKQGSTDPNSGSGAPVGGASGGKRPRASTDEIHMAREIEMAPRAEEPAPRPTTVTSVRRKIVPKVPGWYHVAMPIMFTLASVLMLIGFWALGALLYMAMKTPQSLQDIGYPWISGVLDLDTDAVSYSRGSKIMAGAMLICLPVAIAMGIMGSIMQKRIAAANRAAAK